MVLSTGLHAPIGLACTSNAVVVVSRGTILRKTTNGYHMVVTHFGHVLCTSKSLAHRTLRHTRTKSPIIHSFTFFVFPSLPSPPHAPLPPLPPLPPHSNLPPISQITVKLYKESQSKKKKDKSTVTELGTIELPMHQLADGGEMEKWYVYTCTHTCVQIHMVFSSVQ